MATPAACAAYLYPWDVLDDPAAPQRLAGLGLTHACLAAVYHATRAVTPFHPRHRVVTAPATAAYYATAPERRHGRTPRPAPATWAGRADAFERAAAALAGAGIAVSAWVVLNHVDLATPPADQVVNAYGDTYPWALCPARDAVVEYGSAIAADVAALPGISGAELEACGWFGVDHPGAHDKVPAAGYGFAQRYLLSLCFCAACRAAYDESGVQPQALRDKVRTALDTGTGAPVATEEEEIAWLLGADLAAAVGQMRQRVASRYRTAVTAPLRRAGTPVLLHANPRPHRSAAFTGAAPDTRAGTVDGLVLNCWADQQALAATRSAGLPRYASLLAV
ncbi:MAG TPA: hypothetical protein VHA75_06885, partial [Rugosimonospora sp.]|nr:hypothetical protein [Rugosimonospora sp.]